MASQGPLSPGTLADDSSVGTLTWTSPGNAAASDDSRASFGGSINDVTHYLKATNFGFSIPSGATIDGITVEIERQKNGAENGAVDDSVKLVKGGTVSGNDKADISTGWPAADAYATYGSSSDLWGLSWTDPDINDSNFGVVLSAKITLSGPGSEGLVDHIRITVHYTSSATAVPPITVQSVAISRSARMVAY